MIHILRRSSKINLSFISPPPQQLDPIDPNGPKKCEDGRELICFSFKACFKYTAKPKDEFNASPKIKYRLIAEKDEAGPPRIEFKKKSGKGRLREKHGIDLSR